MFRRSLAWFSFFALQAMCIFGQQPGIVGHVTDVQTSVQLSLPPNLVVEASGLVPSLGYHDVKLVRASYTVPPSDGIQDYFLLATPPAGPAGQVITQVSASDVYRRYTEEAPWLRGVRVHGLGDSVVTRVFGGSLRVRKNVADLSAQEIQALEQGVAAMKARPASDRRSWSFQANIHGEMTPQSDPLWNQCRHGSIHFLTWHRAYLLEFENILRDASGDPNLTLPYWDWSTQRSLPSAFRNSTSPLFDASRSLNNGALIPSSVAVDDLFAALNLTGFVPFSFDFEGSPHGAIHVIVGGNMGRVPTAANDPIFWLHHCNIDRVWDAWLTQGGGRQNPSDAAFLDTTFDLADSGSGVVTHTVSDLLDSANLGYRYADLTTQLPSPASPTGPPAILAATPLTSGEQDQLIASSRNPNASSTANTSPPQKLGLKVTQVPLQFATSARPSFRTAAAAASRNSPRRVLIEFEGFTADAAPRFTYEAYLNLPEGELPRDIKQLHKIGTLNLFGVADQHAHGEAHAGHTDAGRTEQESESEAGSLLTLDATRAIEQLRRAGLWEDEELVITLAPITPVATGQDDPLADLLEESAQKANLRYSRINLKLSTRSR